MRGARASALRVAGALLTTTHGSSCRGHEHCSSSDRGLGVPPGGSAARRAPHLHSVARRELDDTLTATKEAALKGLDLCSMAAGREGVFLDSSGRRAAAARPARCVMLYTLGGLQAGQAGCVGVSLSLKGLCCAASSGQGYPLVLAG